MYQNTLIAFAFIVLALPTAAQDKLSETNQLEPTKAPEQASLMGNTEPNVVGTIEPALTIAYPPDGTVFEQSDAVNLLIQLQLPDDISQDKTEITIVISNKQETRQVFSDTFSAGTSSEQPHVIFPLSDFEAGEQVITAYAIGAQVKLQTAISIFVHDPMKVQLAPVVIELVGESLEATFKAEVSAASDHHIGRYLWTIGQGGPSLITKKPVLQYKFPPLALFYDLYLEVIDINGAKAAETFEFELTDKDILYFQDPGNGGNPPLEKAPPPAARTCGCKQMVIKTKAKSALYCAKPAKPGQAPWEDQILCNKVAAPKPNPCAPGETPYECPLGRLDPVFRPPVNAQGKLNWVNIHKSKLSYGFEVEATLQPKSNAKLCDEGQFIQSTILMGGGAIRNAPTRNTPKIGPNGAKTLPAMPNNVVIPVLPGGAPAPKNGAKTFGRDNYDAPSEVKRYHGNEKITWFDRPRSGPLTFGPPRGGRVTIWQSSNVANEFISYVSGKTGTCWCRFSLDNQWDFFDPKKTGTGITKSKTMPNGQNCVIR